MSNEQPERTEDQKWKAYLSAAPALDQVWFEGFDEGYAYRELEVKRLHEVNQELLEALGKAVPIFEDARRAIRKILVERDRGMGYFHAELDWLISHDQEISDLRKRAKTLIREAKGETE